MKALLELLDTMKQHAERERKAVRGLDARQLFDLAAEGERLAQQLSQQLSKVSRAELQSPEWKQVRARATEVRALSSANAELMRRSLQIVRAVRAPHHFTGDDAPAFISRVA
jgi:hypothetical protein